MTDILHADLSSGTNLTSPTLPSLSSLSLSFPPSEKQKKKHKLTSAIRKCTYMYISNVLFWRPNRMQGAL